MDLIQLTNKIVEFKHKARLWWLGYGLDTNYQSYLRIQFNRTFSRRNPILMPRTKLLIDKLVELVNPPHNASILCIGCRNNAEIDYFKSKVLMNVVGIDLFSESPDILVMDMHDMTFPNNHFDIIYSSNSLEHAYNVHKVVNEIIRVARLGAVVAIEVPVHYETRGADLIDFQNCENLHTIFQPFVGEVLWSDEQPPFSPQNESGTAVIRSIFYIRKDEGQHNIT